MTYSANEQAKPLQVSKLVQTAVEQPAPTQPIDCKGCGRRE